MSLKFTTTKLASAQEAYSLQKLELLNATEALNSAWMDLTDAQREIDGLQEIMDNVHQSVEMLTKFGVDAIPMLNTDGGLEALLQIPERLITVEKAMEAMDEQKKSMWQKFKEIIRRIWTAIRNFISMIADRMRMVFDRTQQNIAKAREIVKGIKSTESIEANVSQPEANDQTLSRQGMSEVFKAIRICNDQIKTIGDSFSKSFNLVKNTSVKAAKPDEKINTLRRYLGEIFESFSRRASGEFDHNELLETARIDDENRERGIGGVALDGITYYTGKFVTKINKKFICSPKDNWDSETFDLFCDELYGINQQYMNSQKIISQCKAYDLVSVIPDNVDDPRLNEHFFKMANNSFKEMIKLMGSIVSAASMLCARSSSDLVKIARAITPRGPVREEVPQEMSVYVNPRTVREM